MGTLTRRSFLGQVAGGIALAAGVRSWPFRVFSFPKEIHIVLPEEEQKAIARLYREATLGWDEPDLIWVADPNTYRELVTKLDKIPNNGLTEEIVSQFKEIKILDA